MGTTWYFATDILNFLLEPADGMLSPFPGGQPVFTEPTGMFAVTVDLAFRGGLLVALPFFIIGLYRIAPTAPLPSRKFLAIQAPAVIGLYAAGLAFVYFIMLPRGLSFLLNFGTDVAVPLISINAYFGLMKALLLWVPLVFQMPVLMYLLAKSRVLSYRRIGKARKVVPFGLAVFTGIITPTVDLVNFLMMYIPMLLLFEVGMFLMWTVTPDQGNYLLLRSIGHLLRKVAHVIMAPYRGVRWFYRKVRFW